MHIRRLRLVDFNLGFLGCLNNLSETKFPSGSARARNFFEKRRAMGVDTWVAVHNGRVVGTYSLLIEPKFIHGGSYVAHIEDVAVDPNWVGKGVGKAMLCHALAKAKRARCYKAVLYCSRQLVSYYEKFGFYNNGCGMRLDFAASETRD